MKPFLPTGLLLLLTSVCGALEPDNRAYNFNTDWLFVKNDIGSVNNPSPEEEWTSVSCPHTWNDVDTFDDFGMGGHQGESNLWKGTAWYRKYFRLPDSAKGKQVFIEFEGVRQVADVYLNGVHLGTNETGFIPFGFNLTPHLKADGENVLSVRVNNTTDPHLEGDRPWNHQNWHPPHGGIYRNVRLHVLDPVHVTLPLYSSLETQGVYAWTETLTSDAVTVGIEAELANMTEALQPSEVQFEILDQAGERVAFGVKEVALAPISKTVVQTFLKIEKPLFWEPDFPHVYQIRTTVSTRAGMHDSTTVPYGPRIFRWNKDTGFWINGNNLKLHGWGHKPTGSWPGLGAAIPNWLRDLTLKQMDDAGGNLIRWGHSAGSATEVRLSDQYGLITIMPGVDGERDCWGKAWETRRNAFRDTLIYYRNHPSILLWEGGNYHVSVEHAAELRELIHTWDPHGKRYFGFRMSTPAMLPYIDIELGTVGRRRALPMLPVVETEYDRMEAPRRLWDAYSPPYFGFMGEHEEKNTYRSHSELFAVNAVKEWWTLFGNKPDHSGGANWIFTDEPHGTRNYTDTARATGEVDGVRLPKQAYFALQTLWRDQNAAFLIGHWNYPEETSKTIYAVAKGAETVELVRNGVSLGMGVRSHQYLFEWNEVQFEPGKIEIIARNAKGKVVATDVRETAGEPDAIRLTPILAPGGWSADGSDVVLVDVEVVDAEGRRCPTAHPKVTFEMVGAGVWRGGYNSGRENSTNHEYLYLEAGINRVSIRSTRESGKVRLIARSEGLKLTEIELETQPFQVRNGIASMHPQEFPFALPEVVPAWDAEAIAAELEFATLPRIVQQVEREEGRIFSAFRYTGVGHGEAPAPIDQSTLAYTDSALHYLGGIPDYLQDSFVIRTALNDMAYWATDYIVATASEAIELYVAHDSRVETPRWLSEGFEKTSDAIKIEGVWEHGFELSLYRKVMQANENLQISGNADQGKETKQSLNMVLFAKPLPVQ